MMQVGNSTTTPPAKSIFQSRTFWGAVLTAIASVSPVIAKNVSDYQEKGKIDPGSVSQIVVVLATTGLTILGRLEASAPLYTPDGFPGRDKPKDQDV